MPSRFRNDKGDSPAAERKPARLWPGLSGKLLLLTIAFVAWAAYEMPKQMSARYRAGVEFSNGDAEALSLFCEKHKRA